MYSISVKRGSTVTLPLNTLTRFGYEFNGWKTLDGRVVFANGYSFTVTENYILNAIWSRVAVTHIFPNYWYDESKAGVYKSSITKITFKQGDSVSN